MSTEQNKKVVLRWRDELNKGNLNAIDELHAPDYVGHIAGTPGPVRGREALKQFFARYLAAFDVHVTPEFLIADGDLVVRNSACPALTSTGLLMARSWNSGSKLTFSLSCSN